jgi:hypothetical protein
LKETPHHPTDSALRFVTKNENSMCWKLKTSYQKAGYNINFHIVGIVKGVVAQICEMVEEKHDTQHCYKATNLTRFAIGHSEW